MHRLLNALREHRHFFLVVTLLTLMMTFPTIIYVFKTDVFWLPTGSSSEIFIELWDIWYTELILTGQADRFHTNLIYYPDGVSLAYDAKFLLFNTVVIALQLLLPLPSAFCLAFLLLIGATALTAYAYALWLFKDKWIALLAAAIFALSPQVLAHPYWIKIAWIAPIPIILYLTHRGIVERRRGLVVLAGLLSGILSEIVVYNFICMIISLILILAALAVQRWRDRQFWVYVLLLAAAIALSCVWRLLPLLDQTESLGAALDYYDREFWNDLVSFFVNPGHPILGPSGHALLNSPPGAPISPTSYLGLAPMMLMAFGLYDSATRRKMLPWLGMLLVFVVLHLGSMLTVNGTVFESIKLPLYYLKQFLPAIFQAFVRTNHFMAGVCLPLAILACYGLSALRSRFRFALLPGFVLLLVGIIAFENYIPVPAEFGHPRLGQLYFQEEPTFVDWLEKEEEENIRLIHLPLGRTNSKFYYFYQTLSGYPQTEGAISRVPDAAYDYIRANFLLNAWHQQQPISCELVDRDEYRSGLAQLKADGFSHVVFHREFIDAELIKNSFREAEPSYVDEYVWIFRLNDLSESCADELDDHLSFTRAYADAWKQRSILDDRPGTMLVFPPTIRAADHFLHYLHHFAGIKRSVVTVTSDEQTKIQTRHSDLTLPISSSDLEEYAALWLVNSPQDFDAEQAPAFQDWFAKRFHFCRRFFEDERATIDAYLRAGIPCSAMEESSAMEVQYDSGVRLNNVSFEVDEDLQRFYLAWTYTSWDKYAYSLQFFDEDGQKALQDDKVIRRRLLSAHEIDVSSLPEGHYSVQLIVYDFETHVSQGGNVTATSERFERELEIAKIEWKP